KSPRRTFFSKPRGALVLHRNFAALTKIPTLGSKQSGPRAWTRWMCGRWSASIAILLLVKAEQKCCDSSSDFGDRGHPLARDLRSRNTGFERVEQVAYSGLGAREEQKFGR